MSDIFSEVDEEVRREQLKKLWERYGVLIIAACVLIVAGAGGWRAYQWWESKKAAEWGATFQGAALLSGDGKSREAEDIFARIAVDGTASYRMLAKFREAAELAQRDPPAAVTMYDQLAADGSVNAVLKDLAALRAGMILADTATYGDLVKRLEPLTAADRTFRHTARTTLALAAWRAQDTAATKRWTDMVLADPETPAGARGQIQMLLALPDADAKS